MFKHTNLAVVALGLFLLAPASLANGDLVSALAMQNPQLVDSNVLTGGQPSLDDLSLLKSEGFGVVVNLRTSEEPQGFNEAEEVRQLGMSYIQIPISAPDGISRENAQKLHDVLSQTETPVVVHCASGNRVGALFALRAYFIEGLPAESSMEIGRNAGLTRLEPLVRQIIETSTQAPDSIENSTDSP